MGMPGVPSLTISVFVTFNVTQKSVRYRCRFLLENHGKKMRAKENASVPSKLNKILQNISESGSYEEEILGKPKDKQKDRQKAEEVRGMSLESLKEAKKKRQSEQSVASESQESGRKRRNKGSETMTYLREKAEIEFEVRKDEMKTRNRKEENYVTARKQKAICDS